MEQVSNLFGSFSILPSSGDTRVMKRNDKTGDTSSSDMGVMTSKYAPTNSGTSELSFSTKLLLSINNVKVGNPSFSFTKIEDILCYANRGLC